MAEDKNAEIIDALRKAYGMELETVINYLTNSIALDGVMAEEIKSSLAADVQAELGHATQIANRIKTIGGDIPGSLALEFDQKTLQPPVDSTDVVSIIKGVIHAENDAIKHYNYLIRLCDGIDYVTQDLAITILGDEEGHRREFQGFLKEYEKS
jgi:bacterioferritin